MQWCDAAKSGRVIGEVQLIIGELITGELIIGEVELGQKVLLASGSLHLSIVSLHTRFWVRI